VAAAFEGSGYDRVIHLAAQAGVRYSLENPMAYVESNLTGFTTILEACRAAATPHLVFASTSSVYGGNTTMPFAEGEGVDHPLQFYAATKRANELMAHAYAHLFRLPCTGLRFFTVYGPWGRPDMAPMIFAKAIVEGRPIKLFNEGRHSRDFTYVDDIAEGVIRAADTVATPDPAFDPGHPDPATSNAPYRIYNIGNSRPVELGVFIAALEDALGRPAVRELLPLQPGDVPDTFADTRRLEAATGWRAEVGVEEGVRRFVEWFRTWEGLPDRNDKDFSRPQ
jgi:UDP-glucuronate 4-epimerase